MEPNQMQNQVSSKTSAKDFFINLGAIVALGFFVGNHQFDIRDKIEYLKKVLQYA
jgi:hypothetical protein